MTSTSSIQYGDILNLDCMDKTLLVKTLISLQDMQSVLNVQIGFPIIKLGKKHALINKF